MVGAEATREICAKLGISDVPTGGLGENLVPPVISHGWNDPRTDRPRFHVLFDYMGADDPSPHLAVPAAIDFLSSLHPSGLPGTMDHNRHLALAARDLLCESLEVDQPAPDSMIGSLASVPLPDSLEAATGMLDPLGPRLFEKYRIQVPVFSWPKWPERNVRISAAAYNDLDQYHALVAALKAEL